MPKDPKGRKRPADVISNAVLVMKIATGEVEEAPDTRNQAALALSRLGASKGGKATAAKSSPRRRTDAAKRAAKARWSK
jgi:hypothetical protein